MFWTNRIWGPDWRPWNLCCVVRSLAPWPKRSSRLWTGPRSFFKASKRTVKPNVVFWNTQNVLLVLDMSTVVSVTLKYILIKFFLLCFHWNCCWLIINPLNRCLTTQQRLFNSDGHFVSCCFHSVLTKVFSKGEFRHLSEEQELINCRLL